LELKRRPESPSLSWTQAEGDHTRRLMMSTKRWAGLCLIFLGVCFLYGLGCGSSSSGGPPGDGGVDARTTVTGTTTQGAGGSTSTSSTTSTTTSTTVGTGGAGTGTGGAGGGTPGSKLGAACASAADCGTGLTCIRSSDNLSGTSPGGVGKGLCT